MRESSGGSDFGARMQRILAMPGKLGNDCACYEGIGEGNACMTEDDRRKRDTYKQLDQDITCEMLREGGLLRKYTNRRG